MNKTYTIDEIEKKSKIIFAKNNVARAYLFGSYAYGSPHGNSDIDIALDAKNTSFLRICGMMEELSQIFGKSIDIFDFREIEKDSNIMKQIEQKGVLLYEAQ